MPTLTFLTRIKLVVALSATGLRHSLFFEVASFPVDETFVLLLK